MLNDPRMTACPVDAMNAVTRQKPVIGTGPAMHITYVLLSPTFGMHQYTADLANRLAAAGHRVDLVTTTQVPRDRYHPQVQLVTPVAIGSTGFNTQGLRVADLATILATPALSRTDLVHVTGVHLWNVPLVWALRRRGVPVVHTLHDLDPHQGVRFARLIRLWNRLIVRSAAHVLVHGRCYRSQLIAQGLDAARVTFAPLLHGFWGYGQTIPQTASTVESPDAASDRQVLFFGRIEPYKGVDLLLHAWPRVQACVPSARLVIAGPVANGVDLPPMTGGVDLRSRRIDDAEGLALFAASSLLVLPYRDATQSALIAAAYALHRPVLVTRTGALPESVVEGQTGWVVPPADADALAIGLQRALADAAHLVEMGVAGRAWYDDQRIEEWRILTAMYGALV